MKYIKIVALVILTSAFALGSTTIANETEQNRAIFEVA